uniref:Uncharacterized protein n=1 Tax=Acrobeloides nanus TaxID=290746 RepID=A0A914D4Y6_9BILA
MISFLQDPRIRTNLQLENEARGLRDELCANEPIAGAIRAIEGDFVNGSDAFCSIQRSFQSMFEATRKIVELGAGIKHEVLHVGLETSKAEENPDSMEDEEIEQNYEYSMEEAALFVNV